MGMQQRKEPEITKFFCGVVQNQENTADCRGETTTMCVSSQLCPALGPTRLLCPWIQQSNNTGVGSHFLFHRISLIQGTATIAYIAGGFFFFFFFFSWRLITSQRCSGFCHTQVDSLPAEPPGIFTFQSEQLFKRLTSGGSLALQSVYQSQEGAASLANSGRFWL